MTPQPISELASSHRSSPDRPQRFDRRLLTRAEIIAELQREIDADNLTIVAARYGIKLSQLSDIMRGDANLSKKARAKLKIRLWEFYERIK